MLLNHEKQTGVYKYYAQLPLTARPLDLLYFLFFAMHLPATLLVDLQYIYPSRFVPSVLSGFLEFYVGMSRDPLIGGLFGAFGDNAHLAWFKTFIYLEGLFQVPVFVLGLLGLYRGSRKIYPLLALYGASSATTTLACLVTVLQTPILPASLAEGATLGITQQQCWLLLSSYVPFFVIPLLIAVDMAMRLSHLVQKAIEAEEDQKWK